MARYRIQDVLGRGGFGTVYRATFEDQGGFERQVAIKLLHADLPADAIHRFRDEVRILGLLRDRAVVSVSPPIQLGGRWAVVMDYVDGVSVELLVLQKGPLPPRVALEIVQEAARALDVVYRHAGPDGQPLHLLHRDIKPANLQITPAGTVKLLDFGIAKATFDAREAHTTSVLVGTPSYMSPERLKGRDGPGEDVYALGLVLRRMLTGEKPIAPAVWDEGPSQEPDPGRMRALELAAAMADLDPARRPSAREVEARAEALSREVDGPSLRAWAETEVKPAPRMRPDDLVGETLTMAADTRSTPSWRKTLGGGALLLAGVGVLAVVCAGGLATWTVANGMRVADADPPVPVGASGPTPEPGQPEDPADVAEADPDVPDPAPAVAEPIPEPVAAPVPAPTTGQTPGPRAPDPAPVASPVVRPSTVPVPATVPVEARPVPAAAPGPVPTVAEPEPEPAAPAASVRVTFGTPARAGATVSVDGRVLGQTPLVGVSLPEGAHTVIFEQDGATIERTITLGPRRPTRFLWRGGDSWEAYVD